MKIAFTVVESLRATPSPYVRVHWQVIVSFLGSVSPRPSRCTVTPESTEWSIHATAIGTIDPITVTEFEFVLAAYILPLS